MQKRSMFSEPRTLADCNRSGNSSPFVRLLPLKARLWIASRFLDLSTWSGEWALKIAPEIFEKQGKTNDL